MVGLLKKEKHPAELSDSIKELLNHPSSLRFAQKVFDIGIREIKNNLIYFPLIPYKAEIVYKISDESYFSFDYQRKYLKKHPSDSINIYDYTTEDPFCISILRIMGGKVISHAFSGVPIYGAFNLWKAKYTMYPTDVIINKKLEGEWKGLKNHNLF
ncbi:MAG TPA: hypothetical protein VEC16_03035 [Alphaproteobacteria bacterium]|nr:hypothetical protein [Alphaproteobacteria bacterium]